MIWSKKQTIDGLMSILTDVSYRIVNMSGKIGARVSDWFMSLWLIISGQFNELIEESLGQFERSNKLDSNERLIFFIVEKVWVGIHRLLVRFNKWSLVKEEECVLFARTALRETQTHGSNTRGTQTHSSSTKRDTDTWPKHKRDTDTQLEHQERHRHTARTPRETTQI